MLLSLGLGFVPGGCRWLEWNDWPRGCGFLSEP